jgi:hypothetical protein
VLMLESLPLLMWAQVLKLALQRPVISTRNHPTVTSLAIGSTLLLPHNVCSVCISTDVASFPDRSIDYGILEILTSVVCVVFTIEINSVTSDTRELVYFIS